MTHTRYVQEVQKRGGGILVEFERFSCILLYLHLCRYFMQVAAVPFRDVQIVPRNLTYLRAESGALTELAQAPSIVS